MLEFIGLFGEESFMKTRRTYVGMVAALACVLAAGCSDCDGSTECEVVDYGVSSEFSVTKSALEPQCSIKVCMKWTTDDKGKVTGCTDSKVVDMETDYVPNVTACENGGAPLEALRTQAVNARTDGYYYMHNNKIAYNGTLNQVYNCSYTTANERTRAATDDTSGYILRYKDTILCAFYVSGSKPDYLNDECKFPGAEGSEGWVSQQGKVTYNWGKSGDGITQSKQGYVDPKNYANRGTVSQNGATCLARHGWVWENIVKYFYGMDIEIIKVNGECIAHPACKTAVGGAETIIDDSDECFERTTSNNFFRLGTAKDSKTKVGYGDDLQFAYTWDKDPVAKGVWKINVSKAGTYQVFANIDSQAGALSAHAPYTVRAKGTEKTVHVDLTGKNGWVLIGSFDFAEGGDQWVMLTDATGEPYTDTTGKRVIFDAIKFVPGTACTNECESNGQKECHENGVRTCGDANDDGCLEWSAVTPCNAGKTCNKGACEDAPSQCSDECSDGAKECSGDNGWRTCGQFDEDSCLEWGQVTPCGAGEICQSGGCVPNEKLDCTHECAQDEKKCEGDSVVTCGQFDEDECREWSEAKACPNGQKCSDGECVSESEGTPSEKPTPYDPNKCKTAIDGRESTIIDELDECFEKTDSKMWSEMTDYGQDGHLYYANVRKEENLVGIWHLNVKKSGKYTISVYVEGGLGSIPGEVRYLVKTADKAYRPSVNVDEDSTWLKLGDYELKAGEDQYVRLTDEALSEDDVKDKLRVLFDAIKVEPAASGNKPDKDPVDVSAKSKDSDCSTAPASSTEFPAWLLLAAMGGLCLRRRRIKN